MQIRKQNKWIHVKLPPELNKNNNKKLSIAEVRSSCNHLCYPTFLKITASIRYHLRPVKWLSSKRSQTANWRGCGEKGILVHCWCKCKLLQPLLKTVERFLRKLKIQYGPEISFLGIFLKETKTLIQRDMYTPVFISISFTGSHLRVHQQING